MRDLFKIALEFQNKGDLIKAKNVYNKMIMYDASIPHGTTKFVDDRLSIVFFVKELVIK